MAINVISLNLWWGGHLLPTLLDFLRAEDADVLMLQEVYNGEDPALADNYRSMEVLSERLGYPQARFAQAYLEKKDGRLIPHGNAILSKFPITADSLKLMSDPTREFYLDIPEHWPILPAPLQHAEITIDGQAVNFYNMHGVWDLDGDNDSPQRRRMSEIILAETAGKPNVVLAGDSNAKRTNPVMRRLEQQLKPVFGDELTTTFNMRHKTNPGYAAAAVDLMYVSPAIKVLAHDCPDVDISDHRPLVVTLELPAAK